MLYLECPQRWLYEKYYEVEVKPSTSELYSRVFHTTIRYLFRQVLVNGELAFDDLAAKWSDLWLHTAVKCGLIEDDIESYNTQGVSSLLQVHTRLETVLSVVNIEVPWESTWDIFDTVVKGRIPAVVSGSIDGKSGEHHIYTVDTLPAYASARSTTLGLQVYNLPRSAVASEVRSVTRNYSVRSLLIDPFTGDFRRAPYARRDEVLPLLGVAINQIEAGLCLPSCGAACARCPYVGACSSKHLGNVAYENRLQTKREIEECLTTSTNLSV